MGNGLQPNAVWYACVGAILGASVAFGTQNQSENQLKVNLAGLRERLAALEIGDLTQLNPIDSGIAPIAVKIDHSPALRKAAVTIRRGDTLLRVLQNEGVNGPEAHAAVQSLAGTFDPRDIRVGQTIEVSLDTTADPRRSALDAFRIKVSPGHEVVVLRESQTSFAAHYIKAKTATELQAVRGTIKTNLYESAVQQGVPPQVLIEMIRLFSYDVDFQRDIRANDSFEIMFERHVTDDGIVVENSAIEYATMTLHGNTFKMYAFENEDGVLDYYNEAGKGIRKALMRTPINGARLTSYFGSRNHPVLGYTKMHRGVDFAAPQGTPIYAAGNGIIEMRQRWGSFGNYVRIRHGDGFSTAYAHMKQFAKGLAKGSRVKQGDTIGYVGTTGRSTGPHLHYEVLNNNGQVNPMKIRFPESKTLSGPALTAFQSKRNVLDRKWAGLVNSQEFALLEERRIGNSVE
jgi:murein DD-endopeptidase MepM/ murein hydrolase activator NlpD